MTCLRRTNRCGFAPVDLYMRDTSFICVKWHVLMCDMTHVGHDSLYMWYDHVWHESSLCVTWLIPMCDVTCSYVWHDSLIHVTWPILYATWLIIYVHILYCRGDNKLWLTHVSSIYMTWLFHICDMTHSTCDMTHYVYTNITSTVGPPPQPRISVQIRPSVCVCMCVWEGGIQGLETP